MLPDGLITPWQLHASTSAVFQFIDVRLKSGAKPAALTCEFDVVRLDPRHVGRRVACAALQFVPEWSRPTIMGNRDGSSLEPRL